MHSGGHARKRIDFYILLCGIWCFPPFTFFFFSFFFVDRFFLFYFSFFFLQTQVEFFACGLHTKRPRAGCVGEGGRGEAGRLGRAWHRQPALLWLRQRLHARCRTSHCRTASSNFMMPPVCSSSGGRRVVQRSLNDTCGSGNMPRFVARPRLPPFCYVCCICWIRCGVVA